MNPMVARDIFALLLTAVLAECGVPPPVEQVPAATTAMEPAPGYWPLVGSTGVAWEYRGTGEGLGQVEWSGTFVVDVWSGMGSYNAGVPLSVLSPSPRPDTRP